MLKVVLLGLMVALSDPGERGGEAPSDMTVSAIRGETAVYSRCSSCHAVALDDISPNPQAPPLRTIGARYPVEDLEEAFAEGVMVSHDQTMPTFALGPEEIADIVAYLKELHREDASGDVPW